MDMSIGVFGDANLLGIGSIAVVKKQLAVSVVTPCIHVAALCDGETLILPCIDLAYLLG